MLYFPKITLGVRFLRALPFRYEEAGISRELRKGGDSPGAKTAGTAEKFAVPLEKTDSCSLQKPGSPTNLNRTEIYMQAWERPIKLTTKPLDDYRHSSIT